MMCNCPEKDSYCIAKIPSEFERIHHGSINLDIAVTLLPATPSPKSRYHSCRDYTGDLFFIPEERQLAQVRGIYEESICD